MTLSTGFSLIRSPLLIALVAALALAGCEKSSAPAADAPAAADAAPTTEPVAPAAARPAPTVLTELYAAARAVALTPSGMCSFDTIDTSRLSADAPMALADPSRVNLVGWVGDKPSMARPEHPALRIDDAQGTRSWEIALGAPKSRGDVAKHFKADTLANAGYEMTADLAALPPGEYRLSLVYDRSGTRVACDKGSKILIGG